VGSLECFGDHGFRQHRENGPGRHRGGGGLENILYFKAEATEVVTHLVPDESVDVFHIYFPDPGHKRKHHKRRLLTPEFFKLLHRRLVPGGRLEIATDNFDYMIAFKSSLVEAGDTLWANVRETKNERILNPEK